MNRKRQPAKKAISPLYGDTPFNDNTRTSIKLLVALDDVVSIVCNSQKKV
jgi:hypothetical protein